MKKIFTSVSKSLTAKNSSNVLAFMSKVYFLLIAFLIITTNGMTAPVDDAPSGSITASVVKKSYNGADVSCYTAEDAELTISASGGTGVYEYSINNGITYQASNVFGGLSGGKNYVVIVRDSKKNTSNAQWIWVSKVDNPVTISGIQKMYKYNGNNDVSCSTSSDGEISISAWGGTGKLQYSIDGTTFQVSNIFKNLAAGIYTVTVKDANGCTATKSVSLTAPAPVTGIISSQSNVECASNQTGSVTITGQGGVGLYYYSIDGSAFQWSGTFNNLATGEHAVLIRDHNGCMGSLSVNITSVLSAEISVNTNILLGESASFIINVENGKNGLSTYNVVYKDNEGKTFNAVLKAGINYINTGILSASKTYSLVSIIHPNGCSGTVSGNSTITVIKDYKWLGITSNWNDPANWKNGMIPTSSLDVVIPATAFNPVISEAKAMAKNITIVSGATLTVANQTLQLAGAITGDSGAVIANNGTVEYTGTATQTIAPNTFQNNALHDLIVSNTSANGVILTGALDIYGSLTYTGTGKKMATNDYLTLKSTATETARVGDMTGNTFTGKVTVERFIPGVKKAWRFLAVPTMPGQTIHDAWQEGQPANDNTSLSGKGIQITGSVAGWDQKGFDIYAATPSLKTFNSETNAWVGISSTLIPFSNTDGGYMMFIRGDRTSNAFNSPVTPTVLRTKGELYIGDQKKITVNPKQFISVSNPYAAPLDLRKLNQSPNLFFYVWDPNLGNNLGYGAYQTLVKNANGNYIATPGGGSYSHTDNNLIQSGSAFFAYNTKGGYLTIKESSKASENSKGIAFRPAGVNQKQQDLTIRLFGVAANGDATIVDGVMQNFDDTFSNDIDEMDAKKAANTSETFSIRRNGELLSVERKQTATTADTTFLNLTTVKVQAYRFEITSANLSTSGMQGFIEDSYLKTKTPLNLEGTTVFDFKIVNIPGSYAANRFSITFRPSVILPVTFTSVKAEQKNKDIAVEWKVENESNLKQYDVEKSVDGSSFSKVATVPANNSGNYYFSDNNAVSGYNYYRIISVDRDGSYAYTQIVKVLIENEHKDITVSPNPIANGIINLQLTNQPQGIYYVRLLNSFGQTVISKKLVHTGGSSTESLIIDSRFGKGIYQLEINTPDGGVTSVKVIN